MKISGEIERGFEERDVLTTFATVLHQAKRLIQMNEADEKSGYKNQKQIHILILLYFFF